jgi:hypothetical protein
LPQPVERKKRIIFGGGIVSGKGQSLFVEVTTFGNLFKLPRGRENDTFDCLSDQKRQSEKERVKRETHKREREQQEQDRERERKREKERQR